MNDFKIEEFNEIELVQYFLDNLIIRATGGSFDNDEYSQIRLKLINNNSIKHLLPYWLSQARTIDQFWLIIKAKFSTYQERREYLWNEFNQLLDFLEINKTLPIHSTIVFDISIIHELWQKAIERIETEPEGAITISRTLIESTLKHILDGQAIKYNDNTDLSELYKEVAKSLNLAPEQHQEGIFKQILGGANGIISGLGSLRNKLGDAHGKGSNFVKPKSRHSELAVNLSGAMAIFLYKTHLEKLKS